MIKDKTENFGIELEISFLKEPSRNPGTENTISEIKNSMDLLNIELDIEEVRIKQIIGQKKNQKRRGKCKEENKRYSEYGS